MAYMQERFTSVDKDIIIQKKYHSLHAMPQNPKVKQRRLPKSKATEEQQQRINEKHRAEKYIRLLADNFHQGDYYLTLTTEERLTPEALKLEVKRFMDRLRKEVMKCTGEKPKFFKVLENLKGQGRPHAHLLINAFCPAEEIREVMARLWTAGFVKVEVYGGRIRDAHNVASYFSKQNAFDHGAKIDTSRGNLIRREPERKVVMAETFRDEIKAPKGYMVVKELSYNTVTAAGYDYQVAVFEKIERSIKHAETDKIQNRG
jgi:hypothetical protein